MAREEIRFWQAGGTEMNFPRVSSRPVFISLNTLSLNCSRNIQEELKSSELEDPEIMFKSRLPVSASESHQTTALGLLFLPSSSTDQMGLLHHDLQHLLVVSRRSTRGRLQLQLSRLRMHYLAQQTTYKTGSPSLRTQRHGPPQPSQVDIRPSLCLSAHD